MKISSLFIQGEVDNDTDAADCNEDTEVGGEILMNYHHLRTRPGTSWRHEFLVRRRCFGGSSYLLLSQSNTTFYHGESTVSPMNRKGLHHVYDAPRLDGEIAMAK